MWDGVDESNLMNQLNKDQIKVFFFFFSFYFILILIYIF